MPVVGWSFILDEEDEREEAALSTAENEEDEDVGHKSAEDVSAADDVSAAEEASQSDAVSCLEDASQAGDAGSADDDGSAGEEDEDVDVEAAESDKVSVEPKEQLPEAKISDLDDRPDDR